MIYKNVMIANEINFVSDSNIFIASKLYDMLSGRRLFYCCIVDEFMNQIYLSQDSSLGSTEF